MAKQDEARGGLDWPLFGLLLLGAGLILLAVVRSEDKLQPLAIVMAGGMFLASGVLLYKDRKT